jgi:hypothetical protein
MRQKERVFAFLSLAAIGTANQYAQAANVSVNCDKHDSIHKALHLVAISTWSGHRVHPEISDHSIYRKNGRHYKLR